MTQKVAIVTGGAGGIGSVISKHLAESGYSILVADADEARAAHLVDALNGGDIAHDYVVGDLTEEATNEWIVHRANQMGEIIALVNAVGVSPKNAGEKINFFELSPELWDQIMAVNVKAPFLMIQHAYSKMPTDGSASIVNLLSITSKLGAGGLSTDTFFPNLPSSAAYAASKAALNNLTATLSHELSSFNIRVNGVAPGLIATDMTSAVPAKDKMSEQIPMQRFGRPDEVANAVKFLLSEAASYINGASIDINGGWYTC